LKNISSKFQLKEFSEDSNAKPNVPLSARLERPSFEETALVRLTPTKAASLKVPTPAAEQNGSVSDGKSGDVPIGESCKNGGCKVVSEFET
jgi:hypothetical protein